MTRRLDWGQLAAALLVASLPACASPSSQGTLDAVMAFGLIGTSSPDCTRPPSFSNPRVTFRIVDGRVVHSVSFDGVTAALVDEVTFARQPTPDTLQVRILRRDGITWSALLKRQEDGRRSTIQSIGAHGHVFYDNGIELSTGKPAVADETCAPALS